MSDHPPDTQPHSPPAPARPVPPHWLVRRWRTWLPMAAALVVFLPGILFAYPWAFPDDHLVFHENPYIDPPTLDGLWVLISRPIFLDYNPVAWLAVWLQAAIFGIESAVGVRTVSLLLHLLNIALVAALIRRLAPDRPNLAAFAACVFAVHPLNVEPVMWPSGQSWLLAAMFSLLALRQFMRHADRHEAGHARLPISLGALALLLAALMAKSGAIIVPPLILLIDWLVRRRPLKVATRHAAPYLAIGVGFGLFSQFLFETGSTLTYKGGSIVTSVASHLPAVLRNFACWFYPMTIGTDGQMRVGLAFFYDIEIAQSPAAIAWGFAAGALVIVAIGMLWWMAGRTRLAALGALWFLGGQALFSGIFATQWWCQADRYNLISGIGLILLLGLAAAHGWHVLAAAGHLRASYRPIAAGIALVALVGISSQQRGIWRDPGLFFLRQTLVVAESPRVKLIRGNEQTAPLMAALAQHPLDAPKLAIPAPVEYRRTALHDLLDSRELLGNQRFVRAAGRALVVDYHLAPPNLAIDVAGRQAELIAAATADDATTRSRIFAAVALFAIDADAAAMPLAARVLADENLLWQETVARAKAAADAAPSAAEMRIGEGKRGFISHGDYVRQVLRLNALREFLQFYPRALVRQNRLSEAHEALLVARYLFPDDGDFAAKLRAVRAVSQTRPAAAAPAKNGKDG